MAEDARILLLKNKLKLKLEARAQQADSIRKLRSAAMRGDSKAGKEFEAHLDKVMIETHKIDTSGNFPPSSPACSAAAMSACCVSTVAMCRRSMRWSRASRAWMTPRCATRLAC